MNTLIAAVDTSSSGLIHLLVAFVIFALVAFGVWWIVKWMALPSPVDMIVRIILGLIAILVLLHFIGLY